MFFLPPVPPPSDIVLFSYEQSAPHKFKFGEPQIVNQGFREFYNNQPCFDGETLYYVSFREGAQADIYAYHTGTGETQSVTRTPETSEFSPLPMPDGKNLSMVTIEPDGLTQRLYRVPKDGSAPPSVLLDKVNNVGYHAWVNDHTLALFIVGKPHQLVLAHARTQETEPLAEHVGRCLQLSPMGALSYTANTEEESVFIRLANLRNNKAPLISRLVPLLEGSEDYVWLPDGSLLMGSGSKLYQFVPGKDANWVEIADFAEQGVQRISRIAVGQGQIAVVSAP